MQPKRLKTALELKKERHALQQRLYYAKKTGKPEKRIKEIQKTISENKKDFKKSDTDLKKEHLKRTKATAERTKKKLIAATKRGATKKELNKLFNKIVQKNTEAGKLGRQIKKEKPKRKKRKKSGSYEERYTVWEAVNFRNGVMSEKINYSYYKGEEFNFALDDFYNDITDEIEQMESNSILYVVIDIDNDEITDIYSVTP